MTVYEEWAAEKQNRAYREFRAGPGATRDMGAQLVEKPKLTTFELDSTI
jgi:hypothetical protein